MSQIKTIENLLEKVDASAEDLEKAMESFSKTEEYYRAIGDMKSEETMRKLAESIKKILSSKFLDTI